MVPFPLAHGNDPRALPPAELFGHWALAMVSLLMVAALAGMVLKPVFSEAKPEQRGEIAGWAAISLAVLVGMATWITRSSLIEAVAPPPPPKEHAHAVYHGGQIVMWGDYHAEVARHRSGEYRLWLSDAYRRGISAELFQASVHPRKGKVVEELGQPMELSLDKTYLMQQLDPATKSVQVRIKYPGDTIKLDLDFDSPKGPKSLKDWCGM